MHNVLAAALLAVFSLIVLFSSDTEIDSFDNIILKLSDQNLVDIADSVYNYVGDSSIVIEGEILPHEGFTNSLLALDGVKLEHTLEISNAMRFHVDFRYLVAGEELIVELDKTGNEVLSFRYIPDPVTSHILTRVSPDSMEYKLISLPTEKKYRLVKGTLESTLDQTLSDIGMEKSVTATVNGILECVIDFRRDARKGDKFSIFLEEQYYNGSKLKGGKVLYAAYEGTRTGKHTAYYFEDLDKTSAFNAHYTRKGQALLHSSLRLPVDKVHVTSSYGYRVHPVTGKKSFHYGVDYRGKIGDPVYAVAPGKVIYSGYDKLNGNKIVIKHNDNTKTYYLHLNKRRVKKGALVKSRERIADIGRTGRVTGPHLHFGVKNRKGKWVNPLNKRMIATPKLDGERYARFMVQMDDIDKMIHDYKHNEEMMTEYTLLNLGNDQIISVETPK